MSLRPGIIDTDMQAFVPHARPSTSLPSIDMFRGFHASGQLVAPDVAAAKIVETHPARSDRAGATYSYAEL